MAKLLDDSHLSRRRLLAATAAAGLVPLLAPKVSHAADPSLVVFLHLDMKQRALQEMLGAALGGVTVTAVGRYGDLERQVAGGASAVLAIGPVLSALGVKPTLSGLSGGRDTEPYALLRRARRPNVQKVGAVDLLGRKGTNSFVQEVLKARVEVERVTKLEDMLRLLQFEMADAILLQERMVGPMRSKSELALESAKAPSEVSLPTLAVLNSSGNIVADQLKRVPSSVRSQLGVDSWR